MPKILINEKDNTSSGTPGNYSNYSVLITGFMGNGDGITVKADSNGVYEFNSAQDFKDTIGLVPPEKIEKGVTVYHHGNQMAYELLNLGYSIIYKPIKDITEMLGLEDNSDGVFGEKFWEIFKDKVSYDFRFITHGFLKSSSNDNTELNALVERYTNLDEQIKGFDKVFSDYAENYRDSQENRLAEVEAAIEELTRIELEYQVDEDTDEEAAEEARENAYKDLDTGSYPGLTAPGLTVAYDSFSTALTETKKEKDAILANIDEYTQLKELTEEFEDVVKQKVALEEFISATSITKGKINDANKQIANLAKYTALAEGDITVPGRGDCIALLELDENTYTNTNSSDRPEVQIINAINELSSVINDDNGKYSALTAPSVSYVMSIDEESPNEFNNNTRFPGAFHYLACFINSLKQNFAEWYAAAGYTRGVSSFTVEATSVKLGEIAINALEPRNLVDDERIVQPKFACNVIANFRGSYYLWGNRTALTLKSSKGGNDLTAASFLNIRQLCTTIKKQLYVACRRFTFDPNSDTLWVNFVNAIRPTLEVMKADQGIRDYKILKEYTDKKATLKAKIRIIPIEAVEDFDLEVSLEDSFGETTAVVTE